MIENYRNYVDGLCYKMFLFFIYFMIAECINSMNFKVILEDD
jgi:hypothetical protein